MKGANRKNRRTLANAVLAVLALVALVIPPFVSLAAREILVLIAISALLALGLNVVVGFAGLLDLGYIAFYATGAYTWGILSGAGPIKFGFTRTGFWDEWGFWIILATVLLINMAIGVTLGSPTLRLRGDYLAIVTLGFGEIVRIVANNLDSVTGGALGISQYQLRCAVCPKSNGPTVGGLAMGLIPRVPPVSGVALRKKFGTISPKPRVTMAR